ncbi:MAG: RIP metalloprotease RseP [Vicinamibacterales bacterium]
MDFGVLTTPLAFLFVLGVLVFVHELGHFLVARWYGVRVITFSLGFGPKIFTVKRGGTEYCVSAVPLGGYVKLAGETVEEERSGEPDEFLSKSRWIRFQVYLAGPVMNFILAFIVLTASLMGGADVPVVNSSPVVVGAVTADSPAARAGIQPGDRVLSVDGRDVPTWDDYHIEILPKADREVTLVVDRAGQPLTFTVTPNAVGRFEMGDIGLRPVVRPQVAAVTPGSPAERAGLQRGDVVLGVGDERGLTQPDIIDRIRASEGRPLRFVLERDHAERDLLITPENTGGTPMIGAQIYGDEFRRIDPGFFQAMRMSVQQNAETAVLIGRTLKSLFEPRGTPMRQLIGPIGMAELSGSAAQLGWQALFGLMAMISMNLGLLNLLPVPVLDGGHIAILAVEGLARRDISVKVKERMLLAGVAAIMLLMVTVIYNDIARYFR